MKTLIFLVAVLGCCYATLPYLPDFSTYPPGLLSQLSHEKPHNFPVKVTCYPNTFLNCSTQYYINAGYGNINNINSPQQLFAIIRNLLNTGGKPALLKICSAGNMYTQCMGGALQEYVCFVPTTMVKLFNMTVANAIGYTGIFYDLHFACGAALFPELYNFKCVINTGIAQNASIQLCNANFQKNIVNGMNYCTASQTFSTCYGNVYTKACNAEVGWEICEKARINTAIYNPLCPTRCTVANQMSIEETQEGETAEVTEPNQEISGDENVEIDGNDIAEGMNELYKDHIEILQGIAKSGAELEKKRKEKAM